MNGDIRILIVDESALLRRMLCDRLQREPGFVVVGCVGNASEGLAKTVECSPNIILMDIEMPGLSCFDAARRMLSICPEARILFLTTFARDHDIEQVLAVRASGCLTKRDPPETLVAAIREVASGGVYFSDEVRARIVLDHRGIRVATHIRSRLSYLTAREIEVLRYVASGLAQKQVAVTMNVSVKTVDNHCANLMNKLGIHNRVELTRFAIREGIVHA